MHTLCESGKEGCNASQNKGGSSGERSRSLTRRK